MSNHSVDVVEVRLEPHPNADTLSVVRVYGFTCCVRTSDWQDGELAAYIPPDSIVDTTRPEFAFLAGHERIKVKRLRGIVSMGLLVKAPAGARIGDDVAEALGVKHYEPPMTMVSGGDVAAPPPGYRPNYDVENCRRYEHLFEPGELVICTEKVHGANSRFCFADGQMHAGSKSEWKKFDARNIWWRAVEAHPWLTEFCQAHPEITVYAEVFGAVQSLKYGTKQGELKIAVFDLLRGSEWISYDEARAIGSGLFWVPEIYRGPYDGVKLRELAEGPSLVPGADHYREGIVIKPAVERTHPEIGRVQLKLISNTYLEKN